MRTQNTAYIQELVSQGFVVAAMDHTYDANITIFPNGKKIFYDANLPEEIKLPDNKAFEIRYRQLSERTQDVIFVLNQLEKNNDTNFLFYNKLQLDNVGIFGHSFGGATSISSAFNDHRIAACFTLDAWFEIIPQDIMKKGLNIAHFHLGQEKWTKPLNYENRAKLIKNSSGPNWIGLTNILTATLSFCFRAALTKDKCPSCKEPIVGTKPSEPDIFSRLALSSDREVNIFILFAYKCRSNQLTQLCIYGDRNT